MKDCIFCKIINGEIPTNKFFENERVIAFNDINPQAPVHMLIIPKKHISTIMDITEADSEILSEMYFIAKKMAEQKRIDGDGFRLVLNCKENAGQAVFHIHLHLLGGRKFAWPPG